MFEPIWKITGSVRILVSHQLAPIYVEQLLKEIKVNKSSAYDPITPWLLKESASVIYFFLFALSLMPQLHHAPLFKKEMNSVRSPLPGPPYQLYPWVNPVLYFFILGLWYLREIFDFLRKWSCFADFRLTAPQRGRQISPIFLFILILFPVLQLRETGYQLTGSS